MSRSKESDYRRVARAAFAVAVLALVALTAPAGALAHDQGYAPGYGAAAGYGADAAPYQLAFATDGGYGYYQYYTGTGWSEWQGWADQPVAYEYDPYAIVYGGKAYVFYTGSDAGLYYNVHDGAAWSGWANAGGGYMFSGAPYAKVDGGSLYLIGRGHDGHVYYATYDGYEWSGWYRYDGDDYPYGYGNDHIDDHGDYNDYDGGYGY